MKNYWLIQVNKGSGPTGYFLSQIRGDYVHDNRDATIDRKKAVRFNNKESAEAIYKLLDMTAKDWLITHHADV